MPVSARQGIRGDVSRRAERTLEIAHRWGYGLRVERLADLCYGGPLPAATIDRVTLGHPFAREEGFVVLRGHDELLTKSAARRRSHARLNGAYMELADAFVRDLVERSPFVRAVAVSGSLASEGLGHGDDIDFNLFAATDTKYIVYLQAILLSLRLSFRHRSTGIGTDRAPFLRKIACVNVVWTEDQVSPFLRRDASLAFELLRSFPVYGADYYGRVLAHNPWLADHFPQALDQAFPDRVAPRRRTKGARLLVAIARSVVARRALNRVCRAIAWFLYAAVQASRFRNPEARERRAFLRRVKFPYEVFQD